MTLTARSGESLGLKLGAAGVALVASAAVAVVGSQLDASPDLALRVLLFAVPMAIVVQLLGNDPWTRSQLTVAGGLGAVAAVVAAQGLDSVAYAIAVGLLAGAVGVLQYLKAGPSSILAVLAVASAASGFISEQAWIGIALMLALVAAAVTEIFAIDATPVGVGVGAGPVVDPAVTQPLAVVSGVRPVGSDQLLTQDGHSEQVPPPSAAPGQAGTAAAESSLSPSASSTDIPYATVGARPRLLRSSDVAPPVVTLAAPAGHQYDGFGFGDVVIRAASHVGTKHMHHGEARQDAYAVGSSEDGRFVAVAVADGVGSQRWSALGADWAATSAVGLSVAAAAKLAHLPEPEPIAERVASWLEQSVRWLGDDGEPVEFSTTLVVGVVDTSDFDVVLFRVGDSTALIRTGERWARQFAEDTTPGAATHALPGDAHVVESTVTQLEPGTCLVLLSDGLADMVLTAVEVADFFHSALDEPLSALEFSSVVGVQRQQAHDDQTAVALWRTGRVDLR